MIGMNAKDFLQLKNSDIKEFYLQLTPSEKKDFDNSEKRMELLKKMPDFRNITDNHEKLIRVGANLKGSVEEVYNQYEKSSWAFLTDLEYFEKEKQTLFDQYNSCILLQDRFTKRQL